MIAKDGLESYGSVIDQMTELAGDSYYTYMKDKSYIATVCEQLLKLSDYFDPKTVTIVSRFFPYTWLFFAKEFFEKVNLITDHPLPNAIGIQYINRNILVDNIQQEIDRSDLIIIPDLEYIAPLHLLSTDFTNNNLAVYYHMKDRAESMGTNYPVINSKQQLIDNVVPSSIIEINQSNLLGVQFLSLICKT